MQSMNGPVQNYSDCIFWSAIVFPQNYLFIYIYLFETHLHIPIVIEY